MAKDHDLLTESIHGFLTESYSTERPDGLREIKGHGPRIMIAKGPKVGDLLGHVDHIAGVNLTTMKADPSLDRHHAYTLSRRQDKNGLHTPVTYKQGDYASHEEAVEAIKKFHERSPRK